MCFLIDTNPESETRKYWRRKKYVYKIVKENLTNLHDMMYGTVRYSRGAKITAGPFSIVESLEGPKSHHGIYVYATKRAALYIAYGHHRVITLKVSPSDLRHVSGREPHRSVSNTIATYGKVRVVATPRKRR